MKIPQIEKRGDTYSIRFGYKDQYGKRKQLRLSNKSKTLLKKQYLDEINKINQGTFIEPSKESLSEYVDDWLANKKSNIRDNTYDIYKYIIDYHIKPEIGHIELKKVNPIHIDKLYSKMKADDYSDWTVFKTHTVLAMTFKRAKRYKLINEDPLELVDTPKVHEKEMDYWDEEEAKKFFSHPKIINSRMYLAFLLPFTTGMRQGEVLGLQESDINLAKKYLEVKRIANYKKKNFGPPKTKKALRRIALDDYTIEVIKKHLHIIKQEKLKAEQYNDQNLLICTKHGEIYSPHNLRRSWRSLLKTSGIRYIRYHDLRHTHATHMLQQPGADIKMVSERLGHKDIKVTLNTYYHVLPGKQEAAAQQYGVAFFKDALQKISI